MARIRKSVSIGRRGWRWYQPYDQKTQSFLEVPIACPLPVGFGSWNAGEVWDWISRTPAEWYEQRTGAKGRARQERILEQRRLRAVERKPDGVA